MRFMKKIVTIVCILLLFILVSCDKDKGKSNVTEIEDDALKYLELNIGGIKQDVTWEDNESIMALKSLAENSITIQMHKYGGFEQVGYIGKSIKSNDTNITTSPGDIVLYSSNQIVIFYGSNEWNYTKLGHINLSSDELRELLGNNDVKIVLETKSS